MRLSGLDLFFWAAGLLGHALLLAVLLIRRRARNFPFFTAMIGLSVLKTVLLFLVFRLCSSANYFYTYWTVVLLEQLVQVAVLYEIAIHVFRPMGRWAADVKRGSLLLGTFSLITAAAVTWFSAPPPQLWQQAVVVKASLFDSALMCEIFLGMIVLSVTAGFPWRTHVARIALGFGVYSFADLLIEGANNLYGMGSGSGLYATLSHVRMALYLCCLGYWAVALWGEAPVAHSLSTRSLEQISGLQRQVTQGVGVLRGERR